MRLAAFETGGDTHVVPLELVVVPAKAVQIAIQTMCRLTMTASASFREPVAELRR